MNIHIKNTKKIQNMNFKKRVDYQTFTISSLLEQTYIPTFQRIENTEHIDTILSGLIEYFDEYEELFLPGVISVGKLETKQKLILLDGQHRVRALEKMMKMRPIDDLQVRVDVYHLENEQQAHEIYTIVNTSKKVELYTGDIAPYVIPLIQKYFKERYPQHCKTTLAPRSPNINLDTLAKRIEGCRLIERCSITVENVDIFLQHVKHLNDFYKGCSSNKLEEWGIKKTESEFCLGWFRQYEWLERLVDLHKNIPFDEQDHSVASIEVKKERKKIPKVLKIDVWEKRFGGVMTGKCFCCEKDVMFTDFDCGHIESVRDGGKNVLDNLEVVCKLCNQDMGTMNMMIYKKLFI